ncbi:unnamed protein product [Prorocentrum cordatum]|uniref:Uncharacterized protein n=1 Tax=Prorocentrum cordatum TaxID=2364126 RepID=A0ABN9RB09_9DINO|nr:unnamed protein product [Polarella glacialis]
MRRLRELGSAAIGGPGSGEPSLDVPPAADAAVVLSETVRGLSITQSKLYMALKRLLVVVGLCSTFYILWFVFELTTGSYKPDGSDLWNGQAVSDDSDGAGTSEDGERGTTGILGLLIQLAVPLCGYMGVTHGSRQLTCCFCGCNLFRSLWALTALLRLTMDGQLEASVSSLRYVLLVHSLRCVLCAIAFCLGNHAYMLMSGGPRPSQQFLFPLVGEIVTMPPPRATAGVGVPTAEGVQA